MKSWGNGAPQLLIDLPATFKLQEDEGPDFTVFRFNNSTSDEVFGIYVGHNPSRFAISERATNRRPGVISALPIEWVEWKEKKRMRSETHAADFYGKNAPRDYRGLILHIFTSAKAEEGMLQVEKFVESLRLETKKD